MGSLQRLVIRISTDFCSSGMGTVILEVGSAVNMLKGPLRISLEGTTV